MLYFRKEQPCSRVATTSFYIEWGWCLWRTNSVLTIWCSSDYFWSHYWHSFIWSVIRNTQKNHPWNFGRVNRVVFLPKIRSNHLWAVVPLHHHNRLKNNMQAHHLIIYDFDLIISALKYSVFDTMPVQISAYYHTKTEYPFPGSIYSPLLLCRMESPNIRRRGYYWRCKGLAISKIP